MPTPALANAELSIMQLLWDQQRMTARDIREQLYPDADRPQHGTVQRLLQRLEDKGFVTRDRSLPVHLFVPTFSQAQYASSQLESLTKRLTGGSLAPLITHLIDNRKLDREEIDRLKQILDESDPAEE